MSRPRGYWQQSAQDLAILHDPNDSNHKGYIRVRRNNKLVLLHVFIWEHFNGPIPTGYEIDHLNGVRWDCRLDNLRCIPKKTNSRNQSKSIKNTSGVTGVRYEAGKWRVRIKINGKLKHLGRFNTFDEAVEARELANNEYGFHSNHGKD